MGAKMTAVNGRVLRWARERTGLSQSEVAAKLNKPTSEIRSWEEDDDFPTYAELEKLAYKIYKRPLAIFFFPEPPEDKDPMVDFRLIPDHGIQKLGKDTRYIIRLMQAKQEELKELTNNQNPAQLLINQHFNLNPESDLPKVCSEVRSFLGCSIEDQRAWHSIDEALKKWRLAVESAGVFVFKKSFKEKEINGFCLNDPVFPVICINNSTAKSRQIFTLFHELAHLLFSLNGYTHFDLGYMKHRPNYEYKVEEFCNRFTAEFLLPSKTIEPLLSQYDGSDAWVGDRAAEFKVSREVILRRLLDAGLVDDSYYSEKRNQWNKAWLNRKKRSGGGDYYRTQVAYLGDTFLQLGFRKYYAGQISKADLAGYFGIKVQQFTKLENAVLGI